jgi:hypothetical protein
MPATKPKPKVKPAARARERHFFEAEVDKAQVEGNVVKGVVLVGPQSKNVGESGKPRTYPESVLEEAVTRGAYENAQLYVDHAETEGARPTRQLLGVATNTRMEDGKVKGDVVVSAREGWFLEDAKDPVLSKAMGFSHDAYVDFAETDTAEEATRIEQVLSVDLVSRPATTRGVFESQAAPPRGKRRHKLESMRVAEAAVGDEVLCNQYGNQVIGEVLKVGPASLVRIGDYVKVVFDDELHEVAKKSDAPAPEAAAAEPPKDDEEPMADEPKDKDKAAPTAKESATDLRVRALEVQNTKLRLDAALAKFAKAAREAVAKRLGKDPILSEEQIAAEVETLEAIVAASGPGVDPELAGPRGTADRSEDGVASAARLFEAFGAGDAGKRAKALASKES